MSYHQAVFCGNSFGKKIEVSGTHFQLHVGHLIPLVSSPVCDIKNAASVSKTLADVCGDKLLIDPTADFFNV